MNEEKKVVKKTAASPKGNTPKQSESKLWPVLKTIWHYIYKFRGIVISLPVLVVAIWEAFLNASRLPERVGLNLKATGEFAMTVTRSTAVLIPLLVTIGCILMTCFTRRTLFPWLISIFSLVLPLLIWIINIYPA